MENFTFQNATRIVFGKGTEAETGKETARFSRRVLLHYGSGSIRKSGLYDRVCASLKSAGVDFVELGGVKPNPRLSLVREGIRLCREHRLDFILAVGGGSVIDSAKAIGIGVPSDGDVWDFYLKKRKVNEMLPVGVVLTIPAAGSEASNGSVITNEDGWYKKDAGGECMRPKFAIMNPELTYTLPPYQTACGAADIMAHVMERYFTRVPSVDFTDRLCEATLRTIIENVPAALAEPEDYDARAQIMWASTIAHNDLLSTGRVGDWATHMIEHELSGIYDVAHGAGLAVTFPAWMKHVYKNDVTRFARFAVNVWGVEPRFDWPERTALEGIGRTKNFFRDIGLPTSLPELGVKDDRFEEMARKATAAGPLGNFVKLGAADVVSIYQLAR
ncbi:MAG TPA: iron-containing alcohol dehydrogenase [Spirochaetia bacterium]|nr:iron-containing alcohol dehydrogenase [Spirochaetia bacterium]